MFWGYILYMPKRFLTALVTVAVITMKIPDCFAGTVVMVLVLVLVVLLIHMSIFGLPAQETMCRKWL
jgi:ABC-type transport system involved in cytochrome bd biosynthesis fused ATPase/permease subunit